MFVVFFTVFTFFFTVFESINISIIALVLSLVGILIYRLISRQNILKLAMLCLGTFFITTGSFLFYNRGEDKVESGFYLSTGQIVDMSSQGKYTFSDGQGEYILSSKQEYQIGEQIRLAGNLKLSSSNARPVFSGETKDIALYSSGTQSDIKQIFSGLLQYQFNYDKRLKMKGIKGTIYENNSIILSGTHLSFISQIRKNLQNLSSKSYGTGDIGGLVMGMLIGDKSQISPNSYQGFIDSGLVHIIAVSGGNIVMLVIFLGFILLRLPFYVRNFFILLFVIGYGLLCGLDSSVFRAVIMGSISLIALFWGREINVWRSLSFAYVFMLLINPYFLVYDVGFLFSFSAIVGLVFFGQMGNWEPDKQNYLLRALHYVWTSYISASLGATIGILPTMIFFMGKINLFSVIGNLLVLPIIPFVMIYGYVAMLFYKILPRAGFLDIEKALVGYIYHISDFVSQYGLYMMVEGGFIKYCILGLGIIYFLWRRFKNQEKVTKI